MVSSDIARSIIGIVGNVISFGLFLSPAPTFLKIYKNKDVEEFSPIPYLATIFNCMLWVFYGSRLSTPTARSSSPSTITHTHILGGVCSLLPCSDRTIDERGDRRLPSPAPPAGRATSS